MKQMSEYTQEDIENVVWERNKYKYMIEVAHDLLDGLGVPRFVDEERNNEYAIGGRLEWLRENQPTLWRALRDKVEGEFMEKFNEEVRQGKEES